MIKCLRNICGILLFLAVSLSILVSCEGVDDNPPVREEKNRTLLIYMAANNDLSPNAAANLDALKSGYIPEEEGNLVVYYHIPGSNPLLLHLNGGQGAVAVDTVYRFPALNSATGEALSSAMNVTRTLFPAKDYGLILWSHATGLLPEGVYSESVSGGRHSAASFAQGVESQSGRYEHLVKLDKSAFKYGGCGADTRSFGRDGASEMEITEMVEALPYKVSFVIFDACFMGGIEVAYQMKDSTDYLLFSPAEVLSTGFPYDKIAQPLFAGTPELQSVAEEFYNFYNSQSGVMRSATVSLVRTAGLDRVAQEAKKLFDLYRDRIESLNKEKIQGYFRQKSVPFFYDLQDFMQNLAGEGNSIADFRIALDEAVIYKASTPYFIELYIDNDKYSGLSSYIPDYSDEELISYYKTLDWNVETQMIADEAL